MRLPAVEEPLAAAHHRLEQDGTVELELQRVADLVVEPSPAPVGRPGPYEAGADRLAGVLRSARRLPQELTVRVGLPGGSRDDGADSAAEAGFRDYCRCRAEQAWREALVVRRTGRGQLPRALGFALIPGGFAAVLDYLSNNAGGTAAQAVLLALAGICLISVWVVIWLPVEELLFDWRPAARTAAAYDLLARSRLELVRQRRQIRSGETTATEQAPAKTAA